jgi:hypothetical protein
MRCCREVKSRRPFDQMSASPSTMQPAGICSSAASIRSGKYRVRSLPCLENSTAPASVTVSDARKPSHLGSYRHPPGRAAGAGITAAYRFHCGQGQGQRRLQLRWEGRHVSTKVSIPAGLRPGMSFRRGSPPRTGRRIHRRPG